MPQVFQVLCCYSCGTFQVHFVKKSNKWQCKICNSKQSLKKAFKIGSAPECRSLVQELNMQRGCHELNVNTEDWEENDTTLIEERFQPDSNEISENVECVNQFARQNKHTEEIWSEDKDFSSDRFFSDSISEFDYENATSENNLSENIKVSQLPESRSHESDVMNSVIKHETAVSDNVKDCDEQKKRCFETCTDVSCTVPPPFKKNRGFQIIKNAALKLS